MEGFTKGLAINLEELTKPGTSSAWMENWEYAKNLAENYEAAKPAQTSDWFFPSAYQWMWILKGCGSSSTPSTTIPEDFDMGNIEASRYKVGGSYFDAEYWTGTEYENDEEAYVYRVKKGNSIFMPYPKSNNEIRAIAAFAF